MIEAPAFRLDASDPRYAVVRLAGKLDLAGTGAIELQLAEAAGACANLAIDMSQVEYLSSIGVRLLLLTARAVSRRGGRMVVVSPHPNAAQILSVAGLERLVAIVPEGDLLSAFGLGPSPTVS